MKAPAISVLAALGVAAAGCSRPSLINGFATQYQPRTRVVAVAPLANNSTVRAAPDVLWEAIYLELRDRQDEYTVEIQNERETKRLIQEAGIVEAAAALLPTDDLCRILQADAIVRGTITSYLRYDPARQFPSAMVWGDATGSEVIVDTAIYDCRDGKLVWSHKVKKTGGFLSRPEGLRERVGGEVAGKFPYKR